MNYRRAISRGFRRSATLVGFSTLFAFGFVTAITSAQDRHEERPIRLAPGTMLTVRTSDAIDASRRDTRVYNGVIDQDVQGENGHVVIPRGSPVELMIRMAPDNRDLILDLDSVVANGHRYALDTSTERVETPNSLIGSIVGTVSGGAIQGPAVKLPRDSVVTFRLERPLMVDMLDPGIDRDGFHWHGSEP
jgi:hypothetical protein